MRADTTIAAERIFEPSDRYVLASPDYLPTKVFFGAGCRECFEEILSDLIAERGSRKVLLLTGTPRNEKTWMADVERVVTGVEHVTFRNEISNPTIGSVDKVLQIARHERIDTVVAAGGGSVLDTGKAVAALAPTRLSVGEALAGNTVADNSLPFMAIPTTSGTGSEVTRYATIWNDATGMKHSLSAKSMYPTIAAIDPDLTATMPRVVAAGTALDALAHAIESCWSINATAESIEFGLEAIRLMVENLERAIVSPADKRARNSMSLASVYAGISIAQAQTTIAHAISYPLTARYGIHHGHACGLSVGALLAFNDGIGPEDCQDPRGYAHVRSVLDRIIGALGVEDAGAAASRIREMIRNAGLKTFDEFDGIDLDVLARDVVSYDRFGNNPRRMSADQLVAFLDGLRNPEH